MGWCSLMFFKIAVLKNYAIFTGKHLGWSLFLINLQTFTSCEYCEVFKSSFFIEHLRWLLLEDDKKRNLEDCEMFFWTAFLTFSWRRPLSYRNQSIDLRSKLVWFLYGNDLRHERVKVGTNKFWKAWLYFRY